MSDKNKHRKRLIADFFRYHRNELTAEERNSFERELQRDPFAEEAADGFASIPPEESLKDIADLQKRIKTRTVSRQRFIIYRVAASVAILMMISTVFIFIGKNKTGKNLSDNSVQPQILEINKSQPVTAPLEKVEVPEKQKDVSAAESKDQQVEKNFAAENIVAPQNAMLAARSFTDSKKIEAKADSQAQGRLDSSISDLSEEVVVGYGSRKSDSETEGAYTGYTPATPVNGKSEFDKYIRNNLHRPDSATTGQRVVVVLSFLVRTDGSIDSIRIVKSPGRLFSDEAIRVIKSGPSWKPAKDSGKPIKDEVRVRLVFR